LLTDSSIVDEYWNHNTAYHPRLLDIAARHHGDVLDVGCGEGLLVQRLAAVSRRVVGIDADAATVRRAQRRVRTIADASVEFAAFEDFAAPTRASTSLRSWPAFIISRCEKHWARPASCCGQEVNWPS
jgi:SAM-dependent methyltransferase